MRCVVYVFGVSCNQVEVCRFACFYRTQEFVQQSFSSVRRASIINRRVASLIYLCLTPSQTERIRIHYPSYASSQYPRKVDEARTWASARCVFYEIERNIQTKKVHRARDRS